MGYLDKDVLKIPSNLNILGDNLLETPPFQVIRNIPKLGYLINNFASYDWHILFTQMPFNFLSYETLTRQAQTMRNNGNKKYNGDSDFLYGFSTYKGTVPQYGLNLKDSENIGLLDRTELENLPTYINQINSLF